MRSSGTPSRIASTTPRTTARTSSSASEVEHTAVPCGGAIAGAVASSAPPIRDTPATTSASAFATPDRPAITVTSSRPASAPRRRASGADTRCGRCTTIAPSSPTSGAPPATTTPASRMRSCSSYQAGASWAFTSRWIRTTSEARRLCPARRSSAAASRSASSRCAPTNASSVAGWAATGANNAPGFVASTRRIAAATTAVETGRRPEAASRGAASSSASWKPVRNATPITPAPLAETGPSSPDASNRRAATPTELPGTITVTGASGEPALARAISARNASAAACPYGVATTRTGIRGIVRPGCDRSCGSRGD